ncbi:peptidase M20 domain-containing protein 2 [Colletotrichum spaethianum]|uniref:Peptidase M20 domain-containing protein 2 n=1 Tax=Colletotrichum spaethianum TaxID=700344 RepID=A0AA37LHW3_9PEZI|nr:peptidase M20 domain-containing protein 2 [Colletotrichum spaethianum]GKT46833.1 peptidase M20 domain-containing protein 2 [Colletotrichum spaethianum]
MSPTEDDDFILVSHADTHPYPFTGPSSPEYLDEISAIVADLAESLWPVNKKIHDNPELGYREFIAHETLTTFMRAQPGWKVTPSAYGMETAWVAVWDSGKKGPVVSFNAEMDCLPGIGHACGHNLIATASLTGALATAILLSRHRLPGKVVLFGTPAEEGGGGKIRLLKAGAYAQHAVDLNLISHPGIVADTSLMRTSAYSSFRVEFFGLEAHAAANPWLGINALDALITSYNAISVLRQQTMPGDVIQGNITHGGTRPNIIHAYAAGLFVVRANTQARLKELKAKVEKCFAAGAEATGAKLQITQTGSYMDHVPNRVLGRSYTRYFNALTSPGESGIPLDEDIDEIRGRSMASTDQGDVSYAMPSLSVGFAIPAGKTGQGPHNPEFAEAAGTRVAFERCLRVGKGLAGVAMDVFTKEGMLKEVKRAWRKDMGK